MAIDKYYSQEDLDKAFYMGLESAVYVLEKVKGLTPEGLQYVADSIKKLISKNSQIKISAVRGRE